MSIVKDINLEQEGVRKIKWAQDFMPVLGYLSSQYIPAQPFAGKRIAMSIHLEAKTAVLALALKTLGAEVHITGCNTLSTQDDVAAGLASLGVNVFAIHGIDEETYKSHLKTVLSCRPDLIIDDGGDLLETWCELPRPYKRKPIGGCEETTTGVNRLRIRESEGTLPFPMVNVNDAKCKHFYDNKYGTGQSVMEAIMHLTNTLIAGKVVVVAGYGYCGRGIAMRARGMGATVIVTEIDPIKAIEAKLDGFSVMTMESAAVFGDYFVTATGEDNVIRKEHMLRMRPNAFLANAGHFDTEINLRDLASISYKIEARRDGITGYERREGLGRLNLLASGKLVNLAGGDGHPAEIMDMSFSVQLLSLLYLLSNKNRLRDKIYEVPEEINEKVARAKLLSEGTRIDTPPEE